MTRPETLPPLQTVTPTPVERLVLDHENPRLAGREKGAGDAELVARLYRGEDLAELLQSIAANGYIDIEPLVVLADGDRLVVLEGNRRLAAVRLFREPGLVERVSRRAGLRIAMPDISGAHRRTLDRISVYRVASREKARSFIGFKHINGAAKWDSYAKARFAADWYRAGAAPLDDIARRIGDRHDTVKRMVNAIYVLDQASAENIFDIADRMSRRLNFSHLYTALSRQPYMRFLGLDSNWSRFDPGPSPVPEENLGELREILTWLYGSRRDDVQPVVVTQNPDVKQLAEILDSPEGLAVLRSTGSLRDAYADTGPADRRFQESLVRARQHIQEAVNNLRGFDGRDKALVGIAEDVLETARAVYVHVKMKLREAGKNEK